MDFEIDGACSTYVRDANAYEIFVSKSKENKPLERPRRRL